jgi:hypothetical protein
MGNIKTLLEFVAEQCCFGKVSSADDVKITRNDRFTDKYFSNVFKLRKPLTGKTPISKQLSNQDILSNPLFAAAEAIQVEKELNRHIKNDSHSKDLRLSEILADQLAYIINIEQLDLRQLYNIQGGLYPPVDFLSVSQKGGLAVNQIQEKNNNLLKVDATEKSSNETKKAFRNARRTYKDLKKKKKSQNKKEYFWED